MKGNLTMDNPCKYCDKADEKKWKHDLLKCDKPCNKAKQWKKCQEDLITIIGGKSVAEVMKR